MAEEFLRGAPVSSKAKISFGTRCGLITMAGVGGIIPTLSKHAAICVSDPSTPMPALGWYIGVAIYFFLGCALCIAFQEEAIRQAFVLGICAPALIANINAGIDEGRTTKNRAFPSAHSGLFYEYPKSAYAQSKRDKKKLPIPIPAGSSRITVIFKSENPELLRYVSGSACISFIDENSVVLSEKTNDFNSLETSYNFFIPKQILEKTKFIGYCFSFKGVQSTSNAKGSIYFEMKENESSLDVVVNLKMEENIWDDIKQALGFSRTVSAHVEDVNVLGVKD